MADDKTEPKQATPRGLEIPVPKRSSVLGLLRKAAKPTPQESDAERRPDT